MPEETSDTVPSLGPINATLLAYWRSLASGPVPPCKADIEPADMKTILPHVVLYERRAPGDFLIRLAGTAVSERIGANPTGMNVLALMSEAARGFVAAALDRVLDEPAAHLSRVADVYPSGREVQVEVLRLPLVDAGGAARFILSGTEAMGTVGYRDQQAKPTLLARPIESVFFTW